MTEEEERTQAIVDRDRMQGERALAWLNEHWTMPRGCPICGSSDWQVGQVGEIRQYNDGNLILGGPGGGVIPTFPVVCTTCGYIHLFSALLTGVVDKRDPEPGP